MRESMRVGLLYVAHSSESEALVLSFPRFASILIEQAMRGDDVFSTELNNFHNAEVLRSAFQSLMVLTSNLTANGGMADFVRMVNFVDQRTWDAHWGEDFGVRDLVEGERLVAKVNAASLTAGFLGLWGHATRLRDFFANLSRRNDIMSADRFKLQQRAREIQSWILNLRSAQRASRFDQVRRKVLQEIDAEVATRPNEINSARSVQQSMDDAFEFWFAAAPALEPVDA